MVKARLNVQFHATCRNGGPHPPGPDDRNALPQHAGPGGRTRLGCETACARAWTKRGARTSRSACGAACFPEAEGLARGCTYRLSADSEELDSTALRLVRRLRDSARSLLERGGTYLRFGLTREGDYDERMVMLGINTCSDGGGGHARLGKNARSLPLPKWPPLRD